MSVTALADSPDDLTADVQATGTPTDQSPSSGSDDDTAVVVGVVVAALAVILMASVFHWG